MKGPTGIALLSLMIESRTPEDAQRLARALHSLAVEDPALHVRSGEAAHQVVIGAPTEEHLETVVDRLTREFCVAGSVGRPQVAYREVLTQSADGEMKYAQLTNGRGQYAHVKIRVHPEQPGAGYTFENHILGGAIPAQFIHAIDEGIQNTFNRGVLTRYPIHDVRVDLYDGSYHDVDSNEAAFRIAGSLAAETAARHAKPVLHEPVMRLEVVVPTGCLADVTQNICTRRGEVRSRHECGETHVIHARVPLAELFGYGSDLRARTGGCGTYTMEFEEYVPVQKKDDDDVPDSLVGAPRKPMPKVRDSGVALPEPDDDRPTQ